MLYLWLIEPRTDKVLITTNKVISSHVKWFDKLGIVFSNFKEYDRWPRGWFKINLKGIVEILSEGSNAYDPNNLVEAIKHKYPNKKITGFEIKTTNRLSNSGKLCNMKLTKSLKRRLQNPSELADIETQAEQTTDYGLMALVNLAKLEEQIANSPESDEQEEALDLVSESIDNVFDALKEVNDLVELEESDLEEEEVE